MAAHDLQELLKAMPDIAKAVNAFTSPEVQREAFHALIASLDLSPQAKTPGALATSDRSAATPHDTAATKVKPPTKRGAAPSKAKKLGALAVDSTLDIEPKGKQSLPDFVTDKAPTSQQQQSLVAVYWLSNIAGVKAGAQQVFTCYKKMGWKAPANPANQLQVIAARKKWLDTSDMDDVKLTHAGSQHVEHSLPPKSK